MTRLAMPPRAPACDVRLIRPLRYASHRTGLPVETFSLRSLVERFGADFLQVTERVTFHVIVICIAGHGSHLVDFERTLLRPGRVLHVRPTQVQRWILTTPYDAQLLLLPDHPGVAVGDRWPIGPALVDLTESACAAAMHTIGLITEHQDTFTGEAEELQILEALRQLAILQLRLPHATYPEGPAPLGSQLPAPYLALRDALLHGVEPFHHVVDYATKLGYSARTLSRACQEATGRTAKQLIDEWIILEARRRLACTDEKVATIAASIGFTDPSNFTKLFLRVAGVSPTAFRDTLHTST